MPLVRRKMSSHQSRDHRRRRSEEDKGDSNMPIKTVTNCATAAAVPNNTTESKGLDLHVVTSSSSSAEKAQIAALMASTATIATEASSIAPSIETTFIAAAAATAQISSGRLAKDLGNSIASLSLSDFDFAEQETEDAATSSHQVQQSTTSPIDQGEFHENVSDTNNNKRDINIDIEIRFLRPRTKELHHHALAMDIVGDLDDEDTEIDDSIVESSAQKDMIDEVQSFQDDSEAPFLSSLKEGLEFMSRPRKSEKHVFALTKYLLDDDDDDDDDSEDQEGRS
jgi:hypothetical protein